MPIYAYRCEHCGFSQDILRKLSDPPLATCPSCGQDTFRKQVTAAGFQLKGSGWYVTDFRNPPAKEGAKADAKGDAKTEGKTESKPGTDGAPAAPAAPAPAPAASDGGSSSKPAASPPSST
jgi:putative FmdB family regulatory protein